MTFLRSTNRWLLKGCEGVLIFLILAMVFMGFGQVVLRKLGVQSLSKLLTAIPIILQHFVLWVAVLGAAIATSRRKHIKIDILAQVLSEARQKWLYAAADTGGVVICFLLTKGGMAFFRIADDEAFVWRSALVIGFGIIELQFIMNLLGLFFPERPANGSSSDESGEDESGQDEEPEDSEPAKVDSPKPEPREEANPEEKETDKKAPAPEAPVEKIDDQGTGNEKEKTKKEEQGEEEKA